jgi:hypothetical protein
VDVRCDAAPINAAIHAAEGDDRLFAYSSA